MLDDATKRLVDEVAEVAGRVGGAEIKERPGYQRDVMGLFDRCRSTFGAVRLLAKLETPDFGQEATVLARAVISESLMLMELAASDERRRIELVIGWQLATLDSLEGLCREGQARGDDVSAPLAAIASQKRAIEQAAASQGIRTRRWRPNEKALAEKHGRNDYLSFRMMHHFVHGSTFATAQRYSLEGDVYFVGGPAADTSWGTGAALQAASAVVYATRAACGILGWDEPAELDDLHDRIEAADAEFGAAQGR